MLIHLIKSQPRSSNQQKLQFYSTSCNWRKSEHVRVFTDQAGAWEGSALCPGSGRIAHLRGLKFLSVLRAGRGTLVLSWCLFGVSFSSLTGDDFCSWLKKSPLAVEVPRDCSCQKTKSPELRSPLFCPWPQGVSSPLCSSAFQAVGEVPAPQGQWLIWKCAESHHCLETYGYYSLIKGNSNFPGDKSCRMQLYYYEQVRI